MMHVIIGENLHDADYVARHTSGFDGLRERVREWTPQRAAELTGIAAEEIVGLAREYATTRPAAIRLNMGLQRSERGAMAVRTIALLPALVGVVERRRRRVAAFHLAGVSVESRRPGTRRPAATGARPRGAPGQYGADWARRSPRSRDPPVKALVVYNSNPAAIAPNQNAVLAGLRRDDLFTVVLEQFQNDTADYADILLPATTFLEHTDLYLRVRPLLSATRASGACRRRARRGRTSRSSARWPRAWVSTIPASAIPTTT